METKTTSVHQLMADAAEGRFSKTELAGFLDVEQRARFLEACGHVERKFTEDCTARNEPCLESGCSAAGEICLQPLLHAGSAYHKACAAAWLPLFRDSRTRAEALKT